jgi:hypothetical protein
MENNKQMTSVEYYNSKVIELMTQREQGNIDVLEFRNQLDLLLTEAKEMEQLQKETEYRRGFQDGKQYYKEEYGNKR